MSLEGSNFFEIELDCKGIIRQSAQYRDGVIDLLQKILPSSFFSEPSKDNDIQLKTFLNESIPIIKWSKIEKAPGNLSVSMMCRQQVHIKNYFYDMISRWLIPHRRLNIDLFFVADFKLPQIDSLQTFSVAEAVLQVQDQQDLLEIQKNIRLIETEIRLGVVSDFHANRILEFKGFSSDKKTAMIQDKIGCLIRSRSKDFGQGIFSDMQYFLVTCRDEFKISRDYHHISRIISVLYIIKKLLKQRMLSQPHRRHLIIKFLKAHLKKKDIKRPVLGVLIGLNFLKENEVCGKNHILRAIRHFLSDVEAIDDSFFINRKVKDNMQMLYLEVGKDNNKDFSLEEINKLRSGLVDYLKQHIEQLIHPIFMPRNEEEVVKNIMTLSNQLKYVHDIPQVIISFEKQTASELSFTVILLRVFKSHDISIKEIFQNITTKFKFVFERVKRVGIMRRKYLKEANVFRVFLSTQDFIRSDHSVDLNKARQEVFSELQRIFGDVRDYNGGMIYKQNQAYISLKDSLGKVGMQNELLLEKFFFSITPVEMTLIRKEEPLRQLFLLFLQVVNKDFHASRKKMEILVKQEKKEVYLVIPLFDHFKKKKIVEKIEKMKILSSDILSFYHNSLDGSFLGYVYFSDEIEKQNDFIKELKKLV